MPQCRAEPHDSQSSSTATTQTVAYQKRGLSQSDAPVGLRWRSNAFFICCTVGFGAFTDVFLYGLFVPVLPFMLQDRVKIPDAEMQRTISNLLAIYAGASTLSSPIAGVLADRLSASRQLPFLLGLVLLFLST